MGYSIINNNLNVNINEMFRAEKTLKIKRSIK